MFGIDGLLNEETVAPGVTANATLVKTGKNELGAFPVVVPTMRFGFAIDTFQVKEDVIRPNQFFAILLQENNVPAENIKKIIDHTDGVLDINLIRAGKPVTVLSKDLSGVPEYIVYEPSVYEYVLIHTKGDCEVKRVKRPITKILEVASGTVESSLWNAMVDNGLSIELAAKMEDALQWSIDFFHIAKGDKFRVLYEREIIDGKPAGVGMVKAAYYKNFDNEYKAIYFENEDDNIRGYYDEEGRPMNKSFLRAPVKYARISSHFNKHRFHPILKRVRPHLGTDYAAPRGTPIQAVGDGVVSKAAYTRGNGNFVKIRHNETYQTQYLHMSRFAKGIRPGVHVKQGQTIGYVGSTGLATGPHVCFRFWKNGKQVDHLKLHFPPPASIDKQYLEEFKKVRDEYMNLLFPQA